MGQLHQTMLYAREFGYARFRLRLVYLLFQRRILTRILISVDVQV